MTTIFYLVVNDNGSVTARKHSPGLRWDEIAIRMQLDLPDALFEKPSLEAKVVIPGDAALPTEIPTETRLNIQEAIKAASGLEVRLSVLEPETDGENENGEDQT